MRLLLAGAAALALGGLALHGRLAPPAEPPPPARPTAPVQGLALLQLAQPTSHTPDTPSALPAPRRSTMPAGPAVVDLCGLGRMPVAEQTPLPPRPEDDERTPPAAGLHALPAPVGEQPLAQARARMLAGLRQGDGRARVAALLLDRPDATDTAAHVAWARSVVAQALASADPAALTWASEACGPLADAAGCRLSLIRARLQREPDNAFHWAALAEEDPGAADSAWQGLLAARQWLERPQALVLASQAALPADLPGYLRLALGADVRARAASLPSPGEGFVLDRCQQDLPGRREQCSDVARLMQSSDALQTLTEAASVAQAAGWSAEWLQALRQEFRDLVHAPPAWQADPHQPLACASVEAWQRHLGQLAQVGELATLRARRALQP